MEIVGVIAGLDRLHNSPNGNPRWRVTLESGATLETARDAALNYVLGNLEYGVPIRFVTNERGNIVNVLNGESGREIMSVFLDELARELGIEQTPEQPYPPVDVLRNFDYTIPRGADEVTDEHAEAIREAWHAGCEDI